VAEELRAEGHEELVFVGTPDGAEAEIVPNAGVRFAALPAKGFDRARPVTLLTASLTILVSTFRAIGLLRRVRPDVVVGFGGYVSLPVGFGAVLTRIPLVLQEQNSVPGIANRVLSRWARAIAVTYGESARYLRHPERVTVTGNPVRGGITSTTRAEGRRRLGVPDEATLLLVFGGSQGAKHLNEALVGIVDGLLEREDVMVLHAAGERDIGSIQTRTVEAAATGRYRAVARITDMAAAIAAADLIVCRAGATSIAEITAVGRAAVLVPYPYATDDHQTTNALSVAQAGGAALVADRDLDTPKFIETVTSLLDDASARATMAAASARLGRPDAGTRVADLIGRTAVQSHTEGSKGSA